MRKYLIGLLVSIFLSGCGGGGTDPIPTPKTDIAQFTGIWKYANTAYDLCYPTNDSNNNFVYALKYGPVTNVNTKQQTEYYFYSDASCNNQMGTIADVCDITWSVATGGADLTNTVRMQCANYTRTFIGITPQGPINANYVYKDLWHLSDNQVYLGVSTGPVDADGYPTQLETFAKYKK
jgi:hypothetical protein